MFDKIANLSRTNGQHILIATFFNMSIERLCCQSICFVLLTLNLFNRELIKSRRFVATNGMGDFMKYGQNTEPPGIVTL